MLYNFTAKISKNHTVNFSNAFLKEGRNANGLPPKISRHSDRHDKSDERIYHSLPTRRTETHEEKDILHLNWCMVGTRASTVKYIWSVMSKAILQRAAEKWTDERTKKEKNLFCIKNVDFGPFCVMESMVFIKIYARLLFHGTE